MIECSICPKCRNEHLIWLEKKCENEIKDLIKEMKGMKYRVENNRVEYSENDDWIKSNYFIQPDDIMVCTNCGYSSQYSDFLKNDNKDLNDKITITILSKNDEIGDDIRCDKNDYFFMVENLFYQQNQELRNTNNHFFKNKIEILRFKTVQENNINDGDIIRIERSYKKKKIE